MPGNRQTIYIDCTSTYCVRLNTGIQRVVRNIVGRATSGGGDASFRCVPVVSFGGRFWTAQSFSRLSPSTNVVAALRNRLSKLVSSMDSREQGVRQDVAASKASSLLAGLISLLRHSIVSAGYAFFKMRFLGPLLLGRTHKVTPAAGDILLMPDAFWDYDIVSPLVTPRFEGVTVLPVIHDLIPITHPEYCVADYSRKFRRLLPRLLRASTGAIAISQATKDELQRYLERNGIARERPFPIGVWYSGADLSSEPGSAPGAQPIRHEISAKFRTGNTFLMVGTIEPRKGHEIVLEAMARLWEQGFTGHLVIVGRVGWLCDALIAEMNASPWLGKNLHIYHDANDAELGFLYRHSTALIFASQAEGFGLPMVEAMQAGLAVIASDIPIFREIGGDYPRFFQPGDVGDLAHAILSHGERRQPDASGSDVSWHSWDEATDRLIDLVRSSDFGNQQASG